MKVAAGRAAIRRASVVLPTPGGPQNSSDGTRSSTIARRRNPLLPTTSSGPSNSSSERGRIRSASGVPLSGVASELRSGSANSISVTAAAPAPGRGAPAKQNRPGEGRAAPQKEERWRGRRAASGLRRKRGDLLLDAFEIRDPGEAAIQLFEVPLRHGG